MSRKSAAEIKTLILRHLGESGIFVENTVRDIKEEKEVQNIRNVHIRDDFKNSGEKFSGDGDKNVRDTHANKIVKNLNENNGQIFRNSYTGNEFKDLEKISVGDYVQNNKNSHSRGIFQDTKGDGFQNLPNSYDVSIFKNLERSFLEEGVQNLEKYLLLDAPWDLGDSPLGGVGVFATKDIKAGELIFIDFPVVLGPRAVVTTSVTCVVCYGGGDLQACSRGCGLPVCGSNCENSIKHLKECSIIVCWRGNRHLEEWDGKLLECLTPIRSLLLNDFQKDLVRSLQAHKSKQHGFEVDNLKKMFEISPQDEEFMRLVCMVLDANAFEVSVVNGNTTSSLRGLYPLASLTNHNCVPNASHVFDGKQRMIVRAAADIMKGEEIFHSYTRLAWGSVTRRFHLLRTKHFLCNCPRCLDPSEYGTYMSAILCKKCGDFVLPKISQNIKNDWECKACKTIVESERIAIVLSVLGSLVDGCRKDSVEDMIDCLQLRFPRIIPGCNEIAIELKLRIVWILGWKENYFWTGIKYIYVEVVF